MRENWKRKGIGDRMPVCMTISFDDSSSMVERLLLFRPHDKPLSCFFDPEVDLAYDLLEQFTQMLRNRTGELLDAWLAQVESSQLPELQTFAAGIEKDKEAVRAGLTGRDQQWCGRRSCDQTQTHPHGRDMGGQNSRGSRKRVLHAV